MATPTFFSNQYLISSHQHGGKTLHQQAQMMVSNFNNKVWFFLMFIYFSDTARETECKWGRGRERRRQRIPSRL